MPASRLCLLGLLALVAGSLAVAAPVPKQKKKQGLLTEMQGRWEMISMREPGGKTRTPPYPKHWTFVGCTLRPSIMKRIPLAEAPFDLNESEKPATFDTWHFGLKEQELGIVKLEDGELIFCLGELGGPRPKNFDSKEGVLYRFKRSTLEK